MSDIVIMPPGSTQTLYDAVNRLTAERDALATREQQLVRDINREKYEHLATINQRDAAVAELRTFKQQTAELGDRLMRERDEAKSELSQVNRICSKVNDAINRAGIHCALFYWEAIDQLAAQRRDALTSCARMAKVVEAAIEWHRHVTTDPTLLAHDRALRDVVDAELEARESER